MTRCLPLIRATSLVRLALAAAAAAAVAIPVTTASGQSATASPSLSLSLSLSPSASASAPRADTATILRAPTATILRDSLAPERSRFRKHFVLGVVTSILAHEAGHVIASFAVGGRPTFGFDKARPTIYSGIDVTLHPQKQFIFSSAGLTVQSLLDEAILDVPHHRGAAFERGVLAGGIGTVLFYVTLGRNGSVSDVAYMARTSTLSKDQVSLIYGGIAALHAVRIYRKSAYAHFFVAPSAHGGLQVGMRVIGDIGR